MPLIFYDTETTGIQTRFDQILQFAAIRTDDDFNELDRFEIRSRLRPDVIASPEAMRVTGVSVEQLFDPSFPTHFEMCKAIHEKLDSWSPATIVGYNSISFDEELLRSAFYQTLLPIYLTNTSGNSRFDILNLARAVHAFAPDSLNWPINEKGTVSFKLDQLAPANGFNHNNAHEAMSDVEATIYVAKLIRDRAPHVWDTLFNIRTKAAATRYAMDTNVFTITKFRYGRQHSNLVTALELNEDNTGQLFTFDLRNDPSPLLALSQDELSLFFTSKPSPIIPVRVNASPTLLPLEVAGSSCEGFELGNEELLRRAELIRNDMDFIDRITEAYMATKEPYPESVHVEEQIFGGFYKSSDQARIDKFHQADWKTRFAIAGEFEDPRLKTLALRLVYQEANEVIPNDLKQSYDQAIAKRLLSVEDGMKVPWTTLDKAIPEAEKILESDPDNLLIRAHLKHLTSEQKRLRKILVPQ
jgi:exodeoxyribonuclease-1